MNSTMPKFEFPFPPNLGKGRLWLVLILAVLVIFFMSPFVVVPAGDRGVKFNMFTGVVKQSLTEGFHFKIPFVESVKLMEVRTQKVETPSSAASKDLQVVTSTIALNFHVDPEKAADIYQTIGLNYRERIIDPVIQESVKAVTAKFTAEELITRRQEVKEEIRKVLFARLATSHMIVDDFSIVDFDFSKEFNTAIESKQTAEQLALKARRDLERIKIEAEQKLTQARAEAEAQRLLRQNISSEIIQLRAIEKWDGKLPQVTSGAVPFVNVKP